MNKLPALLLLFWGSLAAQTASAPSVFTQIEPSLRELSSITGFSIKHKVPYEMMNRTELRQYLDQKMREENKPEEIRAEELTLKKFGLVPADFDLAKSTVDLMTEQAAAFYDDKKKKLVLLEGASSVMEEAALVHELAHALADQHYDLGKFIKSKGRTDDAQLAHLAVVEGQATWLMTEHLARRMGQSLKTSPALVKLLDNSGDMAAEQYPEFAQSPLYLRELLVFPYTQGVAFQEAVVQANGDEGFSDVFRHPPISTQQIMHPDKYLHWVAPTDPQPPEIPSPKDYRVLTDGSVGEFDHTVLLRQYVYKKDKKEADALASEWRGGAFRMYENKKDKSLVLAYVSEWTGEAAAQDYLRAYRQVLRGKWKEIKVLSETDTRVTGRGDDGFFILERKGSLVLSREGLPSLPEEARSAESLLRYTKSNPRS